MNRVIVMTRGAPGIDGAGSGFGDMSAWLVAVLVVLALGAVAWWARGSRRRS